MSIKTYSELVALKTFEERYRYARIGGKVGKETFGFDRYLNQLFYKSDKWLEARDYVIIRDRGCDLGIEDRKICGRVIVHHLNPVTIDDILKENEDLYNPEFLISTMNSTHQAIHYGNEDLLIKEPVERRKNDTCPWRHD